MSDPTISASTTPTDDDLIRAHADLVYATCLRLTGNPQDAADVCQEVFIAWMRQRGQIRGPLAAWLHGTARRRSLDWLRRNHRRAHHERQVDGPAPANEPGDDAWRGRLDGCLAELNDRQRTLVLEHHVLGLSQEALAARWRLSQATISRHLAQALTRLRRGLARHGITAVTLTALPVLLASPAAAAECPADLWSPLAAHLRINGSASLSGGVALTRWWFAWPALVAACLAGVVVLGAGSLLIVRQVIEARLPADPLAELVARLPPAQREVEFPRGTGLHRYLSVEALIARIPAVDEARQKRIRRWLTHDGTSKPWAWLAIAPDIQELRVDATHVGAPSAVVVATDLRVLQELDKLMPDLQAPDATLTVAGWLAADYRDGYFQRSGQLMEACGPFQAEPLYILRALGRQAATAADPHVVLMKIDALTAALNRGTYTLMTSMLAMAHDATRDDTYLRLALQGRLSDHDLMRWCQEPSPAVDSVSNGLLGEMLLFMIPRQDDVVRWGGGALAEDFFPLPGQSPGMMDWLTRPVYIRMFVGGTRCAERIRGTLSGADDRAAILADAHGSSNTVAIMAPAFMNMIGTAAKARLTHNGKRLMAWLVASSRRGVPLPETLDGVVQAVADGQSLLGGTAATFGLRYQRLSDTRFRLELDPASRVPSYTDAEELLNLLEESKLRGAAIGTVPPTVVTATSWEADVARLDDPSAALIDVEPSAPTATQ